LGRKAVTADQSGRDVDCTVSRILVVVQLTELWAINCCIATKCSPTSANICLGFAGHSKKSDFSVSRPGSIACRFLDNPRFGLDGWMHAFDGTQNKYKLGVELTADDKVKCQFCKMDLVYKSDEKQEKQPKWYRPDRYVQKAVSKHLHGSHAH
jgi:hypothetical protein